MALHPSFPFTSFFLSLVTKISFPLIAVSFTQEFPFLCIFCFQLFCGCLTPLPHPRLALIALPSRPLQAVLRLRSR